MTITQLKYVLAAAEYKNFTLAGKMFCNSNYIEHANSKIEDEIMFNF
jgi:hypothetical protein